MGLLIQGVREMGRIAAQHGVRLAYHPHQGTLTIELDASLDPVASARTSVTHLNALLARILA